MKKIRVSVREVANVVYEIEVDNDFTDFSDFEKVGEYLWEHGASPDYFSNEVEEEEIQDAWEVK